MSSSISKPVCDAIKNKEKCVQLERLWKALSFYQSLDLNNNDNKKEDEDKMDKYFNEKYQTLLDDYIHIITKHDAYDLDEMVECEECDLSQCLLARRHQRDRRKDGTKCDIYDKHKNKDDHNVLFYKDVLDSAHSYLCHLYHFGLRVKINTFNTDHIEYGDDNKAKHDDPHFDAHFNKIQKIIKETKTALNKLQHFDFNRYKNNKFNLNIAEIADKACTEMDGLYHYIKEKKVSNEEILRIQKIFDHELYDSDAVKMDIFNTKKDKDSNIRLWINNDAESHLLQQYIHKIKRLFFPCIFIYFLFR